MTAAGCCWLLLAAADCCSRLPYPQTVRTREEMGAFDVMLQECDLLDGYRCLHPEQRSATCWAQKKAGLADPREHWKRYDYACVSRSLVEEGEGGSIAGPRLRLVDVRHRGDAFAGGRPDHVPVESVFALRVVTPRARGGV